MDARHILLRRASKFNKQTLLDSLTNKINLQHEGKK